MRQYEKKLEEEGIEIDEEDEGTQNTGKTAQSLGTGKAEAAFGDTGDVVNENSGFIDSVGRVMEGLGLAGRGKEFSGKRVRKGKEGLLDM